MPGAVWCGTRVRALLTIAAVLLVGGTANAQEENPAFTLKAYADLVQVPTLVLDSKLRPERHAVEPRQLVVSLDSGKRFAPTSVKVEGDDPLNLAIVLDVSGAQRKLAQSFPGIAAEFASEALHPQDRVSIYALDCGHLAKSADQIPADPRAVQKAMEDVLQLPGVVKRLSGERCENRVLLWSAMVQVVKDLHQTSGRRSALIVSDGADRGSRITWVDVHSVAGLQGVALFGLNDGIKEAMQGVEGEPDRLEDLCGATGGVVLHAQPERLRKTLDHWVRLLRGRYVIEFPRPQQMGSGLHSIVVSVQGEPEVFVTVAGVPVKVPDAAQMADPDRVHSDAGADIPMGNRRPMVDGH